MSIFLFRFELSGNGISFVLNEAIAADMYQDGDEKINPLVHACGETLLRYQHLSVSNIIIMYGNILATGEFEVMLSRGLGKYLPEAEKQQVFADAKQIADLLITVMDRRTEENGGGEGRKAQKPLPPVCSARSGEEQTGTRNIRTRQTPPGRIAMARGRKTSQTWLKTVAAGGFTAWRHRIKRL